MDSQGARRQTAGQHAQERSARVGSPTRSPRRGAQPSRRVLPRLHRAIPVPRPRHERRKRSRRCKSARRCPGFVAVLDDKTLLIPDRRGNNRVDTFGNIIASPGIGLIFLVPGINETLRVNGRAEISQDADLLTPLAVQNVVPIIGPKIHVEETYFHCGKGAHALETLESRGSGRAQQLPDAWPDHRRTDRRHRG